jgi:hypothetical protein
LRPSRRRVRGCSVCGSVCGIRGEAARWQGDRLGRAARGGGANRVSASLAAPGLSWIKTLARLSPSLLPYACSTALTCVCCTVVACLRTLLPPSAGGPCCCVHLAYFGNDLVSKPELGLAAAPTRHAAPRPCSPPTTHATPRRAHVLLPPRTYYVLSTVFAMWAQGDRLRVGAGVHERPRRQDTTPHQAASPPSPSHSQPTSQHLTPSV